MPFLRFSRDKRGYESTYLCHTFRRGGKQELRVLYWFRTPPDVKVGRLALDPVAIRAIEESNPDLKFDWGVILKVKPPPPPPDYRRAGLELRRRGRGKGAANARKATPSTAAPVKVAASTLEVSVEVTAEPADPEPGGEASVPAIAAWDDPDLGDEPNGPAERAPRHVVLGLTDEQGLALLRARHAEIQARISDRVRDPARLEALRVLAARLDPDAWGSVDEARDRLASLDEATVAIRKVLGRRRRTRRGGARRGRRQEGRGAESGGAGKAEPEAASAGASPVELTEPSLGEDGRARDE
jgi:hypothetical protein